MTTAKPEASLPPGPSLPSEDQARLWLEKPGELLETCHRLYGDLFTLRLGRFGTMVIVADPHGVRELFGTARESYECRHFNESYRYVMGPHALFLQDGEDHRRLKRIYAPQIRSSASPTHAAKICDVTQMGLSQWSSGGVVPLRPLTHKITLRCLLHLVFGSATEPQERIIGWFRESVWRDLRSWKPWTSLSRLHPQIHAVISAELALRRDACSTDREPALLDKLASARDESGAPLSEEEIRDHILMLMITAGDAIAVAATWALYRGARHPELQERLRAESASLGVRPDPMALAEQPLLSATCQEVLRLHTVLPTVSGRRLTAPIEFNGYLLDAGITLAPCEYLVHRRQDIFEQPLEFRPERFIGRSYPADHYFPFGGGVRACLGSSLAPLTLKLVLATVLANFRIATLGSDMPKVVRYGTLLAPDQELALEVTPLR